jgi:hypothetical protein
MISDKQKPKSVDLQVGFNELTLSIIASSAFGADFEKNAHAKDVLCRTFSEVLDTTEYRSMRMINQIALLSKLPFWRKNILDSGRRKLLLNVDKDILRVCAMEQIFSIYFSQLLTTKENHLLIKKLKKNVSLLYSLVVKRLEI